MTNIGVLSSKEVSPPLRKGGREGFKQLAKPSYKVLGFIENKKRSGLGNSPVVTREGERIK
jgi:hypothetical protein